VSKAEASRLALASVAKRIDFASQKLLAYDRFATRLVSDNRCYLVENMDKR